MFFNKDEEKNNWKEKAKERRAEIKKLTKRIEEIIESRDSWKTKAKVYKEKNENLIMELKKTAK